LLVPFLHAPAESFNTDITDDKGADAIIDAADKGGEGLWAGSHLSVATGFQARSGARATWVGGISLFSDEFAKKAAPGGGKSGNQQFAQDLAAWTFQETLVLRIDETTHHREGETEPRDRYTTNDRVVSRGQFVYILVLILMISSDLLGKDLQV
jgi:oligosaccharyltransferase complex subunit beta